MTANKTAFQTWYGSLPIPWLVGGPNGQAETTAWPVLFDAYVGQLLTARYCSFPDLAPVDALSHIGGDRQLEQGPSESNASFVARLKTAWDDWSRAGQPAEMLAQLYYGGFPGAVLVQQNGNSYTLSAAPTPGVDPTSLLVITALGPNVPRGFSQWWTFDGDDKHGSRFAVLFETGGPAFMVTGTAVFTGAEDGATVPWPVAVFNNTFADTTYHVLVGAPVMTDGGGAVTVAADSATKTVSSVVVGASAPFVGTADVIAYAVGANPYGPVSPGANDLARLRRLINRWRPAKAKCMGAWVYIGGRQWGWSLTRKWGDGGTWGGVTAVLGI